jgi:hypothetical protein
VWKIGPEWVAQRSSSSGESELGRPQRLTAGHFRPGIRSAPPDPGFASAGGLRIRKATGIAYAARALIMSIAVRQSWCVTSRAQRRHRHRCHAHAGGEETARLRYVSNQPVTQAIKGAKIAGAAADHDAESLGARSEWVRLAARLAARRTEPAGRPRGDRRSDRLPHAKLPSAMARNVVIAPRRRNRPPGVLRDGPQEDRQREHGAERDATQEAPAATMTQR